ncbi:hypothetical protein D6783_01320 [Candidatus Woesearchaeota archaeon]|nr:MAG: hypothetical protein D6783_01320 [Candidatus Woesearchaeota archaeon]
MQSRKHRKPSKAHANPAARRTNLFDAIYEGTLLAAGANLVSLIITFLVLQLASLVILQNPPSPSLFFFITIFWNLLFLGGVVTAHIRIVKTTAGRAALWIIFLCFIFLQVLLPLFPNTGS